MAAFNELRAVDVSNHVEKKNGLSYLSWAWAWDELKRRYPESYFTVYEDRDGRCYHTDGRTCWVKTGVTLVDDGKALEHVEYLPVMDVRNRSIPLNAVTSFDVNKAIQRSLTKAAARHGLGLYIYAGEDLPEDYTQSNNNDNIHKTGDVNGLPDHSQTIETPAQPDLGKLMYAFRKQHGLTVDQFTNMRYALLKDHVVDDKPGDDMTLEDMRHLLDAMEAKFFAGKAS